MRESRSTSFNLSLPCSLKRFYLFFDRCFNLPSSCQHSSYSSCYFVPNHSMVTEYICYFCELWLNLWNFIQNRFPSFGVACSDSFCLPVVSSYLIIRSQVLRWFTSQYIPRQVAMLCNAIRGQIAPEMA